MPTLTTMREWAHSAVAVLGWLAMLQGAVVVFLQQIGVGHVEAANYAFTIIGASSTLLSKAIDSANNAATTKAPAVVTAPPVPPVAPPTPTPPTGTWTWTPGP